jgi:membrane-bound lytic murein transglycosylase D
MTDDSCRRIVLSIHRIVQGFSLAAIVGTSAAYSAVSASSNVRTPDEVSFPRPAEIQDKMLFWHQVFYRFPTTTTLVHDSDNAKNILDIIDHNLLAQKNPDQKVSSFAKRNQLNEQYLERYRLALQRFQRLGKRALQFGGIEKRVYSVFSRDPSELMRLLKGEVSLRTQTGLSDEFLRAAERAQDYLPYMERVFADRGVPTRITRLPFVESMFNLKAISKVGASGIWQFMPDTARNYMFVNRYQDERNSPLKASKAAAKLLGENYAALRSWPLAITAYNHGRGGMERAAREVGSRDIGKIIKNYKANSFGFASKNFYAEFLSAARTYDILVSEQKIKARPSNLNLTPIRLEQAVSVQHVLTRTDLSKADLQQLNPCLKDRSFTENKSRLLPQSYELFVPTKQAGRMRLALSKPKRVVHLANQNNQEGED